jgi:predicted nucleotidyltransferase
MTSQIPTSPDRRQAVVDRFVAACRADDRVVAAVLGGSCARGEADDHSDLDLSLITTDEAYDDFQAGREAFIRRLGEVLFLETFGSHDITFFILADGTECELGIGREGAFTHLQSGPYAVLLDKRGILEGAVFAWPKPTPAEQVERLRTLVQWFWHDLSHFTTAIARGQLWWAYGQLQDLRRYCVDLLRLRRDFSEKPENYWKVELAIPVEELSPLAATCVPLERDAMVRAGLAIVRSYRELARPLAEAHGIPYPERLDRVMSGRLERLSNAPVP